MLDACARGAEPAVLAVPGVSVRSERPAVHRIADTCEQQVVGHVIAAEPVEVEAAVEQRR